MKKLLFILSFLAFSFISNAQTALKSQYGNTLDTVVNAGVNYLTLSTPASGYFKTASVAVSVTEISGTTAGAVTCETSLDGITWYNLYSSDATTYTFSPADVTTVQGYRFKITGWADSYLRIKYAGAGTMSAKVSAKAIFRN